ncbi:calcium/sodium antiporter [Porticoccus sp.]|uniref:calcium/sodium antiporter n=1 Tax=Porticoccus sp. TaxID=2024853 RepID=UPI003F699964
METLLMASAGILFGLPGLVWGADRFVAGSASTAKNFGISRLVIGLTIVSLGTSAPEIVIAINAALNGAGDMAVGNAIGSNLANIGLVLGLTVLISPAPVQQDLLKQEGAALLVVTILAGYLIADGDVTRPEGFLLALMLPLLLAIMLRYKRMSPETGPLPPVDTSTPEMPTVAALTKLFVGLAALLVSAELVVWGAKNIAVYFGTSQLIIGLTIVAIGTSLPELAASAISALRGHHDMALGNIFGSNLFNLLAVMSIPGIISPLSLGSEVFYRDYLAMCTITLLLLGAIALTLWLPRHRGGAPTLACPVGVVLLLMYTLYMATLMASP